MAASLVIRLALDDAIARASRVQGLTQMRTYVSDALGSVLAQTTQAQAVDSGYAYSPYGETMGLGVDVTGNPIQYTGRENDGSEGTGLYFYRARFYDPVLKRFISRDPIGLAGGMNVFAYVGADPISRTDPRGLYWFRQPGQTPGIVGRPGTPVEPGGLISEIVEKYVPAGYTFGEMHDDFVDKATEAGLPDWLINVPSMLPLYGAAVRKKILRSLGILDQPAIPNYCK